MDPQTWRIIRTKSSWIASLDPKSWQVTSFDPQTGDVCFTVSSGKVPVYAPVTLPKIRF